MNAEAIMTPGGIAQGFQGLINAAMHIPIEVRQQRLEEQRMQLETQRMQNEFEHQKMQDAFQARQAAESRDRWGAEFGAQQDYRKSQLAEQQAGIGIRQAAENRAQEAFNAQREDRQLGQVERYGLGAATPTDTSLTGAFNAAANGPATMAKGGDAFVQYGKRDIAAAARGESDRDLIRRKTEAAMQASTARANAVSLNSGWHQKKAAMDNYRTQANALRRMASGPYALLDPEAAKHSLDAATNLESQANAIADELGDTGGMAPSRPAVEQAAPQAAPAQAAPAKRGVFKASDGNWYYADTREPVTAAK